MDKFGVIPRAGIPREELLSRMKEMKQGDLDWEGGRTFSLVYHGGEEHLRLLREAYGLYIAENLLNPMAFKSLKGMEAEVVRMTANMLNGPADTVGTMTSGGTESILLAAKTYRERARRKRPWIRRPEMVVAATVHVAFEKAAEYFGLRFVKVPVGDDFRVDPRALRRRIGRNTVMIAASAPQFPQGVIDPITELGQVALEKKLPFHVDACIGGFILPWLERLGHPLPPWDFRVPGVTSISADVHKYGYASKGASTLTFRDMSYMRDQFFISTDWTGGIYASPNMQGTRAGGAVAAAWAAMKFMGEEGYLEMARGALETTRRYVEGVRAIEGLRLLGPPDATLVAIASEDPELDIYVVADLLDEKGWAPDRQQYPASLHVTLTSNHEAVIDDYLADLAGAVAQARAQPELKGQGKAPMYGMMAKAPVRGMVRMSVRKIMESMYSPAGEVPDLGQVGQSEDDDPLLKLIGKYGEPAMKLLDQVQDARTAVGRFLKRE